MGQNQFADWFINGMLGWIRWIANNVASMFQTTSSRASSGSALIEWFSKNWITLLLSLIVLGVVADWLVWMIRWRPYWLWFHKKRVLLDDDIDMDLSDDELMRRYAPNAPERRPDTHPHFKGSALGRGGRPIRNDELDDELYDEYEAPDIEDPYDELDPMEVYDGYDDEEPVDEDDDYVPAPRAARQPVSDEDYEDEERFDQLYDDDYDQNEYEEDDFEDDEEEPDIGFLSGDDDEPQGRPRKPKQSWFAGLKRAKAPDLDDDPFSVDDEAFDDSDDDEFFRVVSDVPGAPPLDSKRAPDEDDTSVYKTAKQQPLSAELSDELSPQPHTRDWRTGYSVQTPAVDPGTGSRKSRRQRREQQQNEE